MNRALRAECEKRVSKSVPYALRRALNCLIPLFFTLLFVEMAFAQEQVSKGSVPAWVTESDLPEPSPDRLTQVQGGIYYLLASRQQRLHDNERTNFMRLAMKVVSREGLEKAGNLSFDFRPETDELTIHSIRRHRDGETVDLLADTEFSVFQQEDSLEHGILDGSKTAFANLQDVRVGDIIEYSHSKRYKSILMPEQIFSRFARDYSFPVARLENRVIVPADLNVTFRQTGKEQEIEETKTEAEKIFSWEDNDTDPISYENNTPEWFRSQKEVQVSSVPSWSAVARDSLDHYKPIVSLPDSFRQRLDEIAEETSDRSRQISKVLSLVQDEIRYVGIEIGRGAFIPRAPDVVLARGYGDCKDKSYLMVEALRHLGIKATPTLAHLTEGASLDELLPSPYAFNHVIVKVEAEGETYWLDPTAKYQYSPQPSNSQVDYGFVLPIADSDEGLEEIVPTLPSAAQTIVRETFSFDRSVEPAALNLKVVSRYKGWDAARFRGRLADNGKESTAKNYEKYYLGVYGQVDESTSFVVEDDRDKDIVETVETYRFPTPAEDVLKDFPMVGDTVRNELPKPEGGERQTPFALPAPFYREHWAVVENLPTDYQTLGPVIIDNRYLSYSMRSYAGADDKTIRWTLRTKSDVVEASEHDDYRDVHQSITGSLSWYYNFSDGILDEVVAEESDVVRFIANLTEQQVTVGFGLGFIGLLLVGLWAGVRGDREYAADGFYYPVSIWKIIVMLLATVGVYALLWFYKFWRWAKVHGDRSDIWPGPRGFFYSLFPMAAFQEANRQLYAGQRHASVWGWLALAGGLGSIVMDRALQADWENGRVIVALMICHALLIAVATIPVALIVNKLNAKTEAGTEALKRNSRITFLNSVAILLFLAAAGLLIILE